MTQPRHQMFQGTHSLPVLTNILNTFLQMKRQGTFCEALKPSNALLGEVHLKSGPVSELRLRKHFIKTNNVLHFSWNCSGGSRIYRRRRPPRRGRQLPTRFSSKFVCQNEKIRTLGSSSRVRHWIVKYSNLKIKFWKLPHLHTHTHTHTSSSNFCYYNAHFSKFRYTDLPNLPNSC